MQCIFSISIEPLMHTSKKNRNSGQPQNCIIFYIKIFFLLEKMGLHPTDTNKCEWLLLFHKTELQSCACPGCAKQSGCNLAYSLCNSQMQWGRPQIVFFHPCTLCIMLPTASCCFSPHIFLHSVFLCLVCFLFSFLTTGFHLVVGRWGATKSKCCLISFSQNTRCWGDCE